MYIYTRTCQDQARRRTLPRQCTSTWEMCICDLQSWVATLRDSLPSLHDLALQPRAFAKIDMDSFILPTVARRVLLYTHRVMCCVCQHLHCIWKVTASDSNWQLTVHTLIVPAPPLPS